MHIEISVTNFKAIGATTAIDVRPITLLFGVNSSGKSSFLHSLLLLQHIVRGGDPNSHRTSRAALSMDVGGRRQYAYLGRTEQPTSWTVRLDPPPFSYEPQRFFQPPWLKGTLQATLSVDSSTVTSTRGQRHPYSFGIQDDSGSILSVHTAGAQRRFSLEFLDHPAVTEVVAQIHRYLHEDGVCEPVLAGEQLRNILNGVLSTLYSLRPFPTWFTEPGQILGRAPADATSGGLILQAHRVSEKLRDAVRLLCQFASANKLSFERLDLLCFLLQETDGREEEDDWNRFAEYWTESGANDRICRLDDDHLLGDGLTALSLEDDIRELLDEYSNLAEQLLWYGFSRTKEIDYLGPLRSIPGREGVTSTEAHGTGETGVGDWAALVNNEGLRQTVNEWLGFGRLGSSLEIAVKRVYREDTVRNALEAIAKAKAADPETVLDAMVEESKSVTLLDTRRGREVSIVDVGVGIAQVLPVLVRALDWESGIHVVEQPELHLHPALQADLADVFIAGAFGVTRGGKRENTKSFILETHSEHLILRLLRRIRETSEDRVPEGLALRPEEVAVYYAVPAEAGVHFVRMEVSTEGDFTTPWPEGFFPERLRELE